MGSGLYLLGLWFSQFYSLRSDSWFKLSKLSVHFSADFLCSSWRICIRAGRPVSIAISQEAGGVRRGLHFYVNICGEQMKCSFGPALKIACLSDEEFHYISACSYSQLWGHEGKNTSQLCVSLFPSTPHNSCEQTRLQGDRKVYIHFTTL